METTTALLFTAYMIPVSLLDNILRPLVMARGLQTPMLIILIGVIGGTISYGITGLFLGPIVLAVIWELCLWPGSGSARASRKGLSRWLLLATRNGAWGQAVAAACRPRRRATMAPPASTAGHP
jgi:hypothetical protein